MTPPLRAGIVGYGRMGLNHKNGYLSAGADITLLCDIQVGRAVVGRGGGTTATKHWSDVTRHSEVDIVSVCTYDDTHAEIAIDALNHGKHVVLEKPACQTREQLAALHAAWQAAGDRLLTCNFPLRGEPLLQALKRDLPEGPHYLEAAYLHNITERLGPDGWRMQMDRYSPVQGGGIHMIDWAMWMIGCQVMQVSGTSVGLDEMKPRTDFRPWTSVNALWFEDGSVANIVTSLDYQGMKRHRLSLPCTGKGFWCDRWLGQDKEYCVRDAVAAVAEGREAAVTAQQVFDTMAVTLACDEAIATGQTVEVEYL